MPEGGRCKRGGNAAPPSLPPAGQATHLRSGEKTPKPATPFIQGTPFFLFFLFSPSLHLFSPLHLHLHLHLQHPYPKKTPPQPRYFLTTSAFTPPSLIFRLSGLGSQPQGSASPLKPQPNAGAQGGGEPPCRRGEMQEGGATLPPLFAPRRAGGPPAVREKQAKPETTARKKDAPSSFRPNDIRPK